MEKAPLEEGILGVVTSTARGERKPISCVYSRAVDMRASCSCTGCPIFRFISARVLMSAPDGVCDPVRTACPWLQILPGAAVGTLSQCAELRSGCPRFAL